MTRSELVKNISVKTGMPFEDVEKVLETMQLAIAESLKKGEEVKLHSFGKFHARKYGNRKCYNPQTSEIINLKPSVQPAFTAGPKLREYLNK